MCLSDKNKTLNSKKKGLIHQIVTSIYFFPLLFLSISFSFKLSFLLSFDY